MQLESTDKIQRVLGIYKKLVSGEIVSKVEEANNYGVNERSIQRDIDKKFYGIRSRANRNYK